MASHKERETRKRGPTVRRFSVLPVRWFFFFFFFETLLVYLCPKHCAHMQVSSILVCVLSSVCVTAGVSKR